MRKLIFFIFSLGLFLQVKSAILLARGGNQDIDTTIVEDIDASDIFLSIRFDYLDGDTVKSNDMQRQQEIFLRKHGMPISGEEEMRRNEYYDFQELDRTYRGTLKKLAGHKYQNLYRQVCSQLLVKNYCAKNISSQYNLNYPNNKLKFYLEEMKSTRSINVGLIYISFIKLQHKNSRTNLCKVIKSYLPFVHDILVEEKSNLNDFSELAKNDEDFISQFILRRMNTQYSTDKQYLDKIERIKNKLCN